MKLGTLVIDNDRNGSVAHLRTFRELSSCERLKIIKDWEAKLGKLRQEARYDWQCLVDAVATLDDMYGE